MDVVLLDLLIKVAITAGCRLSVTSDNKLFLLVQLYHVLDWQMTEQFLKVFNTELRLIRSLRLNQISPRLRVSCGCHATIAPLSRGCHTAVTPLSRGCHVVVTPLSLHCHAAVTPLSLGCHVAVTPLSCGCHATVTPLSLPSSCTTRSSACWSGSARFCSGKICCLPPSSASRCTPCTGRAPPPGSSPPTTAGLPTTPPTHSMPPRSRYGAVSTSDEMDITIGVPM